MREFILAKARSFLEADGFSVTSFFAGHSCFDLAARKAGLTLLVKVFDNVDALREEHALELKKLVQLFNATAIVLGAKTKAFTLKHGVIYERYGLPTLSLDSFKDLLGEKLPSIKSFKGREIVELNADKLKKKRKELGLTLGELANKIDSTTESIHRYEKGHSASLQVAQKLEDALGTKLVKQIDLFEATLPQSEVFDEVIPDKSLEKVHDLGIRLALFSHAPFRAGSGPGKNLLISKGTSRGEVKRRAIELRKTSTAFDSKGMVIASRSSVRSFEHIPIIEEQELTTMSKFNDLMRLLREREQSDAD